VSFKSIYCKQTHCHNLNVLIVDNADKSEPKDQVTGIPCLTSEECFLKGTQQFLEM